MAKVLNSSKLLSRIPDRPTELQELATDCANQLRSSRTEYDTATNPNIYQFVSIRVIRGLCGIGVLPQRHSTELFKRVITWNCVTTQSFHRAFHKNIHLNQCYRKVLPQNFSTEYLLESVLPHNPSTELSTRAFTSHTCLVERWSFMIKSASDSLNKCGLGHANQRGLIRTGCHSIPSLKIWKRI